MEQLTTEIAQTKQTQKFKSIAFKSFECYPQQPVIRSLLFELS